MSAARIGVYAGVGYTLPVAVWLATQLWIVTAAAYPVLPLARQSLDALLQLQAFAVVLCMPWLMRGRGSREHLCGVAALLLVPLPLFALAWLMGAGSLPQLVRSEACVTAFALLTYLLLMRWFAWLAQGQLRSTAIVFTQLLLALALWRSRHYLPGWWAA